MPRDKQADKVILGLLIVIRTFLEQDPDKMPGEEACRFMAEVNSAVSAAEAYVKGRDL